ncbi:MAG TPA: HNH endonuclease [bacterium]|nr:HNH endonuclease [bacterium]
MKEIPLNKGMMAWVDDEDFEKLSSYRWRVVKGKTGMYAYTTVGIAPYVRKGYSMHSMLIEVPPGMVTDHIDGNGLNNQKSNLRVCTHAQNMMNQRKARTSKTSPYKGVSWCKDQEKWRVQLITGGKVYRFGRYTDPVEAARVYDREARRMFGEYARLNFPESACSRRAGAVESRESSPMKETPDEDCVPGAARLQHDCHSSAGGTQASTAVPASDRWQGDPQAPDQGVGAAAPGTEGCPD